ncbi:MAG: hypothetical protein K8R89_01625, partial [Anaerolineae bacterium]|nr:hypothetical protein [Anaerolineae bacterium]
SLDKQCAAAFTPTLYDGLDLMIATAFHSVVFAIQAAIPLIAINYAPKVHRLMTDIGLEEYILEPHAWEQAPALVARVLANHDQLVVQLQDITRTLTNSARQTLEIVRTQIETSVVAPEGRRGPVVTIVVIGSNSDHDNQTTLDSCLEQTYENIEIIFVGSRTAALSPEISCIAGDSASTLGEKLNLAAALATGDYLSWIKAGDFYTTDAIDYLLQQAAELDCEMVYADYYTVDEHQRLCNAHVVHPSYKLFRGDVVGPCFLYRRSMSALVGSFKTESPLAAYDYWLRAQQVAVLRPLHTRLFYTMTAHRSEQTPQAERLTRRHWRAGRSWPHRIIGQLLDTTLVNARVIRPAMGLLRKVRRVLQ